MACPGCGAPADYIHSRIQAETEAKRVRIVALACVGAVGSLLLLMGVCIKWNSVQSKREAENAAEAQARVAKVFAAERKRTEDRLVSGNGYASAEQVLADCDKLAGLLLPVAGRERCGKAHIEIAQAYLRNSKLQDARRAIDSAARELSGNAEVDQVQAEITHLEKAHQRQADAKQRADAKQKRRANVKQSQHESGVDGLVAEMIARSAVKSVDPEEMRAQVNPLFWLQCDADQKRNLVKVLAAFCKGHQPMYGGAVTLFDSHSGRKLAEYSSWSGVKLVGED
jgi:hypothetical protein